MFCALKCSCFFTSIKITGPGLTKYLDSAGNILVLIDEFDGDHQKIGLFCTETKSNNTKYVLYSLTTPNIEYPLLNSS